eukprot:GHVO01049404.1.p1 GENE.GHVO01049404.1~~GHVO01049404.1.p1  ORF type:complete len:189 (+),score=23.10 GHVO01049404.1:50-616(+)
MGKKKKKHRKKKKKKHPQAPYLPQQQPLQLGAQAPYLPQQQPLQLGACPWCMPHAPMSYQPSQHRVIPKQFCPHSVHAGYRPPSHESDPPSDKPAAIVPNESGNEVLILPDPPPYVPPPATQLPYIYSDVAWMVYTDDQLPQYMQSLPPYVPSDTPLLPDPPPYVLPAPKLILPDPKTAGGARYPSEM